jgi:competence protein ComEC
MYIGRVKAKRYIRWTSVFACALTFFLAGLGLARFFVLPNQTYITTTVLILVSLLVVRRHKLIASLLLILLCFGFGWWRGAVFVHEIAVYDSLFNVQQTYQVTAAEDAFYNDSGQLSFTANNIVVNQDTSLHGTIAVGGRGVNAVYAGDRLQVTGSMRPARGIKQGRISFAQLSLEQRSSSLIYKLRRNFAAGLQNALPEPLASFGLGLLIGQRNTLNDTINEELITVGLIHIVAVSGYNLTVITRVSQRLFARFSRYQALVISLAIIGLFLMFTGSSPSIVRAAVVSVLGLAGWYYGRPVRPVLLLLLSAVLTAGLNPLYLWFSIGWYLSFTAFFGVLILSPLLQQHFIPKFLQNKPLTGVFSETFSAQICTLPIILLVFGRLSTISIIANLLVVPVVPFAMLASLFAGIGGMVGPWLATLVAWPAKLLLEYILSISSLLSRIPYANTPFELSVSGTVVLYGVIILVTLLLYRKSYTARSWYNNRVKQE